MMRAVVLCLVLGFASRVDAATLYAKAAGGMWNTAATWSLVGCADTGNDGPPTRNDDVLIEACAGEVVLNALPASTPEAKTVYIAPGGQLSAQNGGIDVSFGLYLASAGTVWSADPAAILNLGVAHFAYSTGFSGGTITFAGGGHSYGSISIVLGGAPYTFAFTGSNTFEYILCITFLGASGDLPVQFDAGATTTLGDFQVAQIATSRLCSVSSATAGMATTFSKSSGTVNVDGLKVTDITATGGATWCAYNAAANGGGNTGWSFTACPYTQPLGLLGVGR